MMNRREVAIALDIPVEMAQKHGIPAHLDKADFEDIKANPPAWLRQSMANRTGKRPVWVHLTCVVCGISEAARPKKWWPEFAFVYCYDHDLHELPTAAPGRHFAEYEGIGSQMIGVVDEPAQVPPEIVAPEPAMICHVDRLTEEHQTVRAFYKAGAFAPECSFELVWLDLAWFVWDE